MTAHYSKSMKTKLYPFLLSFLLTFCLVTLLGRMTSERVLGEAPIRNTSFKALIVQTRPIANTLGLGDSARITMALIAPDGTWTQTQRIQILGKEGKQCATWKAPESLEIHTKDSIQYIPVTLEFPSGSSREAQVNVGILQEDARNNG